jgi:hypothetical protein
MTGRRFFALLVFAMAAAAGAGVLTARRDAAEAFAEPVHRLAHLPELVPAYPRSFTFPLGESVQVSGMPREMAYALTDDGPWKVADRYEAIWQSQGFRVKRDEHQGSLWVTAFSLADPWVRTVIATAAPEGTIILQTVRRLDGVFEAPRVPVPRFCALADQTGGVDDGVRSEMVFLACDAYLNEVIDYYDDALQGTTRTVRLEELGRSVYLTYSEASREVMLAASQADTDPPRTAVSLTWQERP